MCSLMYVKSLIVSPPHIAASDRAFAWFENKHYTVVYNILSSPLRIPPWRIPLADIYTIRRRTARKRRQLHIIISNNTHTEYNWLIRETHINIWAKGYIIT